MCTCDVEVEVSCLEINKPYLKEGRDKRNEGILEELFFGLWNEAFDHNPHLSSQLCYFLLFNFILAFIFNYFN